MVNVRSAVLIATCCLLAAAAPAGATTIVTDFTVPGPWLPFGSGSGAPPFGLTAQPSLQGSFTLTDGTLTGLDYSTGTKTWALADVSSSSDFVVSGNSVTQFDLVFGPGNIVDSHNTASVYDGTNGEYCNNCVSFTSSVVASAVPEPASWAMMLLGFCGIAFGMRRRTSVLPRLAIADL